MQAVIELIGKEEYVNLLKKYNLCTKKWTYGRAKGFYQELNRKVRYFLKQERKKQGRIK